VSREGQGEASNQGGAGREPGGGVPRQPSPRDLSTAEVRVPGYRNVTS
jgi:hypothetical protein